MRWLCPRCRRAISLAFSECPFCLKSEASAAETRAAPVAPPAESGRPAPAVVSPRPASAPPTTAATAPAREVVVRKLVPESAARSPVRLTPVPPRAPVEPRESQLYQGFRFGLGFALALVVVLLLALGFWLLVTRGR